MGMGSSKTRKTKFAFFLRFLVQNAPTHRRGRFFFQAPLASVLRHGGLPVLGARFGGLTSQIGKIWTTCYLLLVACHANGEGPDGRPNEHPRKLGMGGSPLRRDMGHAISPDMPLKTPAQRAMRSSSEWHRVYANANKPAPTPKRTPSVIRDQSWPGAQLVQS
jgi:hypothetical protein